MRITNELTLDVARSNSAVCLLAKQGDSNSRYLDIKLTNEGHEINIPNGAGVILRATKADGTAAAVAGSVSGGKATVEIDDYILDAAGAARASLEITADGEVLTTASFNITVQKADGAGWVLVYVAASNLSAGNYYITLGGVSYSFTTTQTIPSGGRIYFSSNSATAQTRNGSGAVLDAALTLTVGTTGAVLTSDLPTMSFLGDLVQMVSDDHAIMQDALGGTLRQLLTATKSLGFHKTAYVDLGTLNWSYDPGGYFQAALAGFKYSSVASVAPNIISTKYATATPVDVYTGDADKAISSATGGPTLWARDSDYSDDAIFKAALNGVLMAYEVDENNRNISPDELERSVNPQDILPIISDEGENER